MLNETYEKWFYSCIEGGLIVLILLYVTYHHKRGLYLFSAAKIENVQGVLKAFEQNRK